MVARCKCLCGRRVRTSGFLHKSCRTRITLAGGVCKKNVYSAVSKLTIAKHNGANNPKNNAKNNPKNNPKNNAKNNPINSKKRKLALLAKNLQMVQDDPTLEDTLKMTAGVLD